jgi:hypothetical protein
MHAVADGSTSGSRLVGVPLSPEECWDRLRSASIGRVSLSVGALPRIIPCIYAVLDDSIVFRAEPGTPLAMAAGGTVVAFEAGELEPATGEGWTVTIQGISHGVNRPDLRARIDSLELPVITGNPAEDCILCLPATAIAGHAYTYVSP